MSKVPIPSAENVLVGYVWEEKMRKHPEMLTNTPDTSNIKSRNPKFIQYEYSILFYIHSSIIYKTKQDV